MAAERPSLHRKPLKSPNQMSSEELMKELKNAVDNDNVHRASQILDLGADPNGTYYSSFMGHTTQEPFIPSIRSGRMLELFLERGGNVDLANSSEYTLLIRAVQAQNVELVEACLRNGANPNYVTPSTQFSVLRFAAMIRMSERNSRDMVAIFRLLLDAGADPHDKEVSREIRHSNNNNHNDPLSVQDTDPIPFMIIYPRYNNRHPESALPILEAFHEHKADLTAFNPHTGHNLLHVACYSSRPNERLIAFLLEKAGIDIDSQTESLLETPLILAVKMKNPSVVNLLVDHGASVNLTDKDGATPLLHACSISGASQPRDQIIRVLLEARSNNRSRSDANRQANRSNRADVNKENDKGHTPLIMATSNNLLRVMEQLINHGADVNHVNSAGMTALLVAASKNNVEASVLLLRNGANPNVAALTHGLTPLHYASMHGKEALVHELLKHGADPLHTMTNQTRATPQQVATFIRRRNPQYPSSIIPALHHETTQRLTASQQALRSQTTNVGPNVRRHIMGFLKKNKNRNNTKKKKNNR